MSSTASLSTSIDAGLKQALTQYCKRKGLKIRQVIEQGIIEQIEDEIDREAWIARRDEPTTPLEEVVANRRRS
jgi:hypothetical protein